MSTSSTVRLHRIIRSPAERIYRAFVDGAAMAKWLPPHGFDGSVHEMEARVGGSWKRVVDSADLLVEAQVPG